MSYEGPVLVVCDDLFFRARLLTVIERAGAQPVRTESAPVAVVELSGPAAIERVRALVAEGTRVLAFGAHVDAAVLRDARAAGADAVPNSRLVAALEALLAAA